MFLRLVYHFTLTNRYIYLNYYDHRTNDPNAIASANFLKFLASNICKYIIFNIEVQYVCITAYFYNKNSVFNSINRHVSPFLRPILRIYLLKSKWTHNSYAGKFIICTWKSKYLKIFLTSMYLWEIVDLLK